jgi:hypothetical protein
VKNLPKIFSLYYKITAVPPLLTHGLEKLVPEKKT